MLFYSFPSYVSFFLNSIILNYLKQKLLEIIPAHLYCKYFLHGPQKMQDRLTARVWELEKTQSDSLPRQSRTGGPGAVSNGPPRLQN